MSTKIHGEGIIIGLCGKAYSGKTTAACFFERGLYERKSFAKPLKDAAIAMTGLDEKYFYDPDIKFETIPWIGKSPREILQLMGTNFVRQMINKDFWTLRMEEELSKVELRRNIVIDDIRFRNEAALVKKLGGTTIKIQRNTGHENDGHESENIDFPVDYVVDNNTTVDAMERQLARILNEIGVQV